MRYNLGLLLPAILALAPSIAAKKDAPLVETTPFKNELVNLLYFDDSTVALLQELESGRIWRSTDAGKSWKQEKEMTGMGILKNPYDNNVATVLGETKHWITYDQGDNWSSFKTELPPSPEAPLSWHAKDSKRSWSTRLTIALRRHVSDAHSTPPMASSQSQSFLLRTAVCVNGRRPLRGSSWTATSTMTASCASQEANTRTGRRISGC